jgi:hypothetical protein
MRSYDAGAGESARFIVRITTVVALCSIVAAATPRRAEGVFHIAVIDEVMSGHSGSEAVQFVEIRMLIGGQNIVSGSKLSAFDANGNFLRVVLNVSSDVQSGGDRAWIMASTDFAAAAGITPDFTFTSLGGLGLEPTDGMVCWGKPLDQTKPDQYIDCLAYGNYNGPANTHTNAPSPISPFGRSLVRVSETHNNAVDFACNDPAEPENNAMAIGSIAASDPCPVCGNDTTEVTEQCDGTDDSGCPGLCQGDCTCLTECGNDFAEIGEQCDGTDDAVCPGRCQVNCTCGPNGPLGADAQKCANALAKGASKVVGAYGKASAACVSAFTAAKTLDAPAVCVAADPKQKLAGAESKAHDAIHKTCPASGLAWAVSCPAPCDATDDGGNTQAVDDRGELEACLECVDRAVVMTPGGDGGTHGVVLDGVTLATSTTDAALAKCQAKLVSAHEKLFAARIKESVKCLKSELKSGATPPVGATCIGSDPKSKIGKARGKLDAAASLCTPPAVFDAGRCATLAGAALSDCLAGVGACQACLWGNAVFGPGVDCDLQDNALTDASCP